MPISAKSHERRYADLLKAAKSIKDVGECALRVAAVRYAEANIGDWGARANDLAVLLRETRLVIETESVLAERAK